MIAKDFKEAAAMIMGGAIGALVGWAIFAERYNIVACGIMGCALGKFSAMWWLRRKE